MVTKQFLMAGRAVFTVKPSLAFCAQYATKAHYTFKVTIKPGKPIFLSLLTGPNNEEDFTYLGIMEPDGLVRLTRASKFGYESWPVRILEKTLKAVLQDRQQAITDAGWELHHEGKCGKCGRTLTVPESVESGIGPECARKMACTAA